MVIETKFMACIGGGDSVRGQLAPRVEGRPDISVGILVLVDLANLDVSCGADLITGLIGQDEGFLNLVLATDSGTRRALVAEGEVGLGLVEPFEEVDLSRDFAALGDRRDGENLVLHGGRFVCCSKLVLNTKTVLAFSVKY